MKLTKSQLKQMLKEELLMIRILMILLLNSRVAKNRNYTKRVRNMT